MQSPQHTLDDLASQGYIANDEIAMAVYLAKALNKPLLIEGPPGVGKTELAKAVAGVLDAPVIRLQCYEGLDETKAIYEWKYGKQLLYTQILKEQLDSVVGSNNNLQDAMANLHKADDVFFAPEFLEPRPLLQALQHEGECVLLIDEIDKSDEEFEALLLEMLADNQLSLPEIGTIKAEQAPVVFLTSNSMRELSDALKRRCLHLYIPFPDKALETKILLTKVPDINEQLAEQLASFIDSLRDLDLKKQPAVSETIDWAKALILLHAQSLSIELVESTLFLIQRNIKKSWYRLLQQFFEV